MFDNHTLFACVEYFIYSYSDKYVFDRKSQERIEAQVRYAIETKIGLKYIINHKIKALNEISLFVSHSTDNYNELETSLIKSILMEYLPAVPTLQDMEKFNTIKYN